MGRGESRTDSLPIGEPRVSDGCSRLNAGVSGSFSHNGAQRWACDDVDEGSYRRREEQSDSTRYGQPPERTRVEPDRFAVLASQMEMLTNQLAKITQTEQARKGQWRVREKEQLEEEETSRMGRMREDSDDVALVSHGMPGNGTRRQHVRRRGDPENLRESREILDLEWRNDHGRRRSDYVISGKEGTQQRVTEGSCKVPVSQEPRRDSSSSESNY